MLKIKIDIRSIFRKGIKIREDNFLVALITGEQGTGKSYYAIYNVEKNYKNRVIYTNIHSFKSDYSEVRYFNKISDLYNNHDINAVFIIDELSKKYVKDSKIDLQFYSWLQQSRKHQRTVFLITQEYMQVPNWLRGVATLVYTTSKLPFNLIKTTLGFPVLDTDSYDWVLNEISLLIYKRNKKIANKYDTFELINEL